MSVRFVPSMLLLGLAAGVAACSSGSDSGSPSNVAACTADAPFTVTPVAIGSLKWVGPLGNLAPSSHVFPSNHIGFQTPLDGSGGTLNAPLVAPGNITIVEAVSETSTNGTRTFADYTLTFYPCSNLRMYFGHVASLTAALTSAIGGFGSGCDAPYVTGGFTVTLCRKQVSIALAAGDAIGTLGGPSEGAMDFGGSDDRTPVLGYANPTRFPGNGDDPNQQHVICPVDYFASSVRDQLRLYFGGGPYDRQRTAEPVCGTVMQDVPGTAQGRWFYDNTTLEDHHLALVHDQIDPTMPLFSVGTSVATLPTGLYSFAPASSGRVDREFSSVIPDGNLYCYELTRPAGTRVLLQLTTSTHLKIEASAAPAGCGDSSSWAFTAAATEFGR